MIDKILEQIRTFNGGADVNSFPVKFIAKSFGDENSPREEVVHEYDYSENEQFRELRSTSCYKSDYTYPSYRHVDATKQTYDVGAERITEQQWGIQFYRSVVDEDMFSIHYLEFRVGDKTYHYAVRGAVYGNKPNDFIIKVEINDIENLAFTKEIKNSHNFNLHKDYFVKTVTNDFTRIVKRLLTDSINDNKEIENIFQDNNVKLHLEERLDWNILHS